MKGHKFIVTAVLSAVLAILTQVEAVSVADGDNVVLRGEAARVGVATAGGGIVDFRLLDHDVNPLNWEVSEALDPKVKDEPQLRGHFLCLDRWGQTTDAEAKAGVPYHGEAPRIHWRILERPTKIDGKVICTMGCELPIAGLEVRRRIRLDANQAVFTVDEEVTNTKKLGRIYNMVQHPTIAGSFLDDATLVDTNAQHGFLQEGPLPTSRKSAAKWPTILIEGNKVDLRHFNNSSKDITGSDVSSFVFDAADEYGWCTASTAPVGLLLGYLWTTEDYPWLNMWRYIHEGTIRARGLEFGTTGYHQPFPALVKVGTLLDRRLYEYIDTAETVKKSYAAFLLRIPQDFLGVADVSYRGGRLEIIERREEKPRKMTLEVGDLFAK